MTTAATETGRPVRPVGPRVVRWVTGVIIIVPLIWAALGLEISPERIWEALKPGGTVWKLIGAMFPPDWASRCLTKWKHAWPMP